MYDIMHIEHVKLTENMLSARSFIVLIDASLFLTSEASGRLNETWAGMWVYFGVLENKHMLIWYMLISDATINGK